MYSVVWIIPKVEDRPHSEVRSEYLETIERLAFNLPSSVKLVSSAYSQDSGMLCTKDSYVQIKALSQAVVVKAEAALTVVIIE